MDIGNSDHLEPVERRAPVWDREPFFNDHELSRLDKISVRREQTDKHDDGEYRKTNAFQPFFHDRPIPGVKNSFHRSLTFDTVSGCGSTSAGYQGFIRASTTIGAE